MADVDLQEHLGSARHCVKRARDLLVNPRSCHLGDCSRLLFEAQNSLGLLLEGLADGTRPSPELRPQILALHQEVRQASALLEQAAAFGRLWLARLQAASGGYTKAGSPAPLVGAGCISAVA
ncbi:MAG: hypothetical protein U0Q18_13880 [Bryobacteraceae bacterium]